MPTEFGGIFLPEIRAKIEDSSYRRVLWVGFELFIVIRGCLGYVGVRKLRLRALKIVESNSWRLAADDLIPPYRKPYRILVQALFIQKNKHCHSLNCLSRVLFDCGLH